MFIIFLKNNRTARNTMGAMTIGVMFILIKKTQFLPDMTSWTNLMSFTIQRVSKFTFVMNNHMLARRNYLKIVNSVVILYSIYMVDKLFRFEFSTNKFFHNFSMNKNTFLTNLKNNITLNIFVGASLADVGSFIGKRISVSLPSTIVHSTPSSFFRRFIATFNRAFHGTIITA